MWYSKLIDKQDGLAPFLSLFDNEDDFIKHFISNISFFETDDVANQANKIKEEISAGEKIPVRFSQKIKKNFYYPNSKVIKGKSNKSFKNKKEAQDFSEKNNLYHEATNVKVRIDKDGNYYVRKEIFDTTGYKVSQGIQSNLRNYIISHVWANTDNPYYFSSLWNICLIPNYIAFILDKPDSSSDLIKRIKAITKAICYTLYKPDSFFNNLKIDKSDFKSEMETAQQYINQGHVKHIKAQSHEEEFIDITDAENELVELIETTKNKDFIFKLLDIVKKSNVDFLDSFTNKAKTQALCKMSYPILVDVTGNSDEEIKLKSRPVKSDVYYSKQLFEMNGRSYIVCNDWKTNNKAMLLDWFTDSVDD